MATYSEATTKSHLAPRLKPYVGENLQQIPNINHGFFGRLGGVSTGDFATLNTSYLVGDIEHNVDTNRHRIAQYFNPNNPPLLIGLKQIHSARVVVIGNQEAAPQALQALINQHPNNFVYIAANSQAALVELKNHYLNHFVAEGDAIITNIANLLIGVTTADCVPALLATTSQLTKENWVCALHAGHAGAFLGIVQNTIKALVALGAHPSSIVAAIGPSIKQPNYEVDKVFYERFIDQDPRNRLFFLESEQTADHYDFSLPGYVNQQLTHLAVYDISISPFDTFEDSLEAVPTRSMVGETVEESTVGQFFSHRRATSLGQNRGLQLSSIMITNKTKTLT